MSNGPTFNEHGTHTGDNIGRDKTTNYQKNPTDDSSITSLKKEEIVKLLEDLRTAIKKSDIDEDAKDSAAGEVAKTISTTKKTEVNNSQEAKKATVQIGQYLTATNNVLKEVKDVSNILATLSSVAKLLGLPIP